MPDEIDPGIIRGVFTVEERGRVRARLLEMAHADTRIVAGAEIGALAQGGGDRWSDLDLTFGVADGPQVDDVLADWTTEVTGTFDAVHLFDLGPKFTLLFGNAVERDKVPPPSAQHLFGLGAHHAVRARICIERGRPWQAEYWISALRDQALSLASLRHGSEVSYGRGFDELPADTLALASTALVRSLEREELLRALRAAVELLLQEADAVREMASDLAAQLGELTS